MADFLRDKQQEVIFDGAQSSCTQGISDVPQGAVLGPLLFFVYINDMPQGINSTVRLFVDDSLLYRIIPDLEVIKLEYSIRRNDWLFILNLIMNSSFITSRPGHTPGGSSQTGRIGAKVADLVQ